jgi:hypothetical protein
MHHRRNSTQCLFLEKIPLVPFHVRNGHQQTKSRVMAGQIQAVEVEIRAPDTCVVLLPQEIEAANRQICTPRHNKGPASQGWRKLGVDARCRREPVGLGWLSVTADNP